jgi:hypothetical protein
MNARNWSCLRVLTHGFLLSGLLLVVGCGTLRDGRGWGQDAIYPVSGERIASAAKRALLDPVTWVSAGGAVVLASGDFDERVSNWARDNTPIFGSQDSASDASDLMKNLLVNQVYVTALLTPSGEEPWDWTLSKARGLGVEYVALTASAGATGLLKSAVDRERPDGSDRRSFPSGHSSSAFAGMRLSNRNLDSIDMPRWARTSLKSVNLLLASGTGWARVEAGRHHPSDVLAGACLGNLVTSFIHDAFMNLPEDSTFSFYIEPSPRGVFAAFSWDF